VLGDVLVDVGRVHSVWRGGFWAVPIRLPSIWGCCLPPVLRIRRGGGGARGWSGWGCMCLQGRCPVWALLCGWGLLGLCDMGRSASAYPLRFVRGVLSGGRGPPSALRGTSTIVKTRLGGGGAVDLSFYLAYPTTCRVARSSFYQLARC
jgi:hypothetical protein